MNQDLVVLVPDKNTQFALSGALPRFSALQTRQFSFELLVHPERDPGVRTSGVDLLGLETRRFGAALMILDYAGCGVEEKISPQQLEERLSQELITRWGPNSACIVVSPEVDVWIWGSDNSISQTLDWPNPLGIRQWLTREGFEFLPNGKPVHPKEAFEKLLRHLRVPRSSALYKEITSKISLQNCSDAAFTRLKNQLQNWFPISMVGK